MDGKLTIGYLLLMVLKTQADLCSFKNKEPQLLYSDTVGVVLQGVSSGVVHSVYEKNYSTIVSVDYHLNNGDVFWMDFDRIYRKQCNNETEAQVIHQYQGQNNGSRSGANIHSFAVDYTVDKVYWAEEDSIYLSDLDGTKTRAILSGLTSPRKLIIHFINRWIFFSEHWPVSTISRCSTDGRECTTIIRDVLGAYGMAIDYEDNRLYWSDSGQYHVKSAKLDGSDQRFLSANVEPLHLSSYVIMGLDVYEDFLFVSEIENGIYKVKKNEEMAVPSLVTTGVKLVYDLKITNNLISINGGHENNLGVSLTMLVMQLLLINHLM